MEIQTSRREVVLYLAKIISCGTSNLDEDSLRLLVELYILPPVTAISRSLRLSSFR
jgi:hypothetical protein